MKGQKKENVKHKRLTFSSLHDRPNRQNVFSGGFVLVMKITEPKLIHQRKNDMIFRER